MAGSDAMKKLLQQSAQRKEQEIQSINNVAENTTPATEKPVKETAEEKPVEEKPVEEKPVQEVTEKTETNPVEDKTPEAPKAEKKEEKEEKEKVGEKKFADYLIDNKVKNGEVIRISNEAHSKLKKISIATGVGMNVIATNILDDILNQHTKEIQALLKKYMSL